MQYKYGRYGIDNLMLYIAVTMLAVFLAEMLLPVPATSFLAFSRSLILEGQVWRVLTFIFIPMPTHPLFLLVSLAVYYFLGRSLEDQWGRFSFTLYYVFGIIGAIIAGFLTGSVSNYYLNLSLLLAFASLFPNAEFRLFFLIPVKVKYIGYVLWIFYALALIIALISLNLAAVAALIASLANFFLFFGEELLERFRNWKKYRSRRQQFRRDKNRYNDRW